SASPGSSATSGSSKKVKSDTASAGPQPKDEDPAVDAVKPSSPAADKPADAPTPPIPARHPKPWVPRVAGLLCYLLGLFDILSAIFPRVRHIQSVHKFGHLVPGLQVNPYAVAASLIVGVLLVSLAHALQRRKHRAWMGVVALLTTSIAVHLIRREPFGGIALYFLVLVLLIVYRKEFYALSDPKSRWRAIWTFWAMLVGAVAIGLALVSARGDHIIGHANLLDRLNHVALGLAGISGPMHFRGDNYGDYIYFSLFGLGLLTVLVTLYLFLRPAEPAARLTADQEVEIRSLLQRHGQRDSLGYFALRRDKSVLFSPTGKSCIAYRVVSGVMLASGDPIGDPEAWPGAIRAVVERAERYAWIPAVMGCSE